MDDEDVDALLPPALQLASRRYWTPVSLARRAADLFARHGAERILDVGCGPGKFCVVAADTRHDLEFTGIDHREHLVHAAVELSRRLCTINAHFVHGDATRMPCSDFDGFYFFNPFAENDVMVDERLDSTVELSFRRLVNDILRISESLDTARTGTVLVTYHGFGGPIPSSYDIVDEKPMGTDVVRTWKKRRSRSESWCYVEVACDVARVERRAFGETIETACASKATRW